MNLIEKFLSLQKSLTELNCQEEFNSLDVNFKVRRILEICGQMLNVPRIGLWRFSDDKKSITCLALYNQTENVFESGAIIQEFNYPNYFKALRSNRVINVNNAQTDVRTNELLTGYLKPLDIRAMLDAPVFSDGQLSGIICIEQTSINREWDMAEISYAASIADALSLLYAQDKWFTEKQELLVMEQIDPLTNLENRLFFQKRINHTVSSSADNSNCGVLLIGLDGFTGVNDRFGHHFANDILCEVAKSLESIAKNASAFLSRIGGDVFAFWLPFIENANQLNKVTAQLEHAFPLEIKTSENELIHVPASIGIVVSKMQKMLNFDPIRKAEIAMQEAKRSDHKNVCFYDFSWDKILQEKFKLEDEFVIAINSNQIIAYYQPILGENYKSNGFSLEALVRWEHPVKGVISPFIFLPIAKQLGLMKDIGDIVLEQACQDVRHFLNEGLNLNRISINISSEQLFSPSFINQIKRMVNKYQIAFSSLEFEIIEELIAGDSQVLINQLDAITQLGIELSIDDFGTGYSSLSRLKSLNVSTLKIDKSFVDGLPSNEEDICIARSIIGLAKGMNLRLVAEGVETKEQAKWLINNGVDLLQGYLFSKPVRSNFIAGFIKKESMFPNSKQATFEIKKNGNILEVIATGVWGADITLQVFKEIDRLLESIEAINWAIMVDTTQLDAGTIDFQRITRSHISDLMQRDLKATAFIISDNGLAISQLEQMNKENQDYKRKFFTTTESALTWLAENQFHPEE
jgi:diguanylate cyclase (GGDEF)-like protein